MNGSWTSAAIWTWSLGTALLAVAGLAAAVTAFALAAKRKRPAFLGLGVAFLLAAAAATLANPIANMVIFCRASDQNAERLIAAMRSQCPIGHDAGDFIARFGQPARIHACGAREIWTYDPNPWWMIGWTVVEISVVGNQIDGHWLDD